jgi:hypothetical protein
MILVVARIYLSLIKSISILSQILIIILNKGTIGPYDGHNDSHHGINNNLCVQHQFKHFYNKELPDNLKYLVNEC